MGTTHAVTLSRPASSPARPRTRVTTLCASQHPSTTRTMAGPHVVQVRSGRAPLRRKLSIHARRHGCGEQRWAQTSTACARAMRPFAPASPPSATMASAGCWSLPHTFQLCSLFSRAFPPAPSSAFPPANSLLLPPPRVWGVSRGAGFAWASEFGGDGLGTAWCSVQGAGFRVLSLGFRV